MEFLTNWHFWVSLAAAVAVFWVLPGHRSRQAWLLLTSLALFAYIQPLAVLVFLCFAALAYQVGRFIAHPDRDNRWAFVASLFMVLGYLVTAKVCARVLGELLSGGGFASQLVVPIGLSYFTFKVLHYLIECWWRTVPQHTLWDLMLYLFFFPTLPLGPIERFERFQTTNLSEFSHSRLAEGVRRIIIGTFKKIVIAELLLKLGVLQYWLHISTPEDLFASHQVLHAGVVWAALFSYYLYCFVDFAAATDIAIGIAALFGYRICENFNFPLLARNIGEFWRRWHMSLANWVRHYVYFPLMGLTRQTLVAISASMLVIGLWHGITLNWMFWGLHHALALCAFLTFQHALRNQGRLRPVLQCRATYPVALVMTQAYVALGYCFVGTQSLSNGTSLYRAALGMGA